MPLLPFIGGEGSWGAGTASGATLNRLLIFGKREGLRYGYLSKISRVMALPRGELRSAWLEVMVLPCPGPCRGSEEAFPDPD
jgi:hypothetical protein